MPLFLSASSNPGAASWVDGSLTSTPYTVGPNLAYATIQAAIDAAVADGKDGSDPAVVSVAPGTYVEDVALAAGVYLQAVQDPQGAVTIQGTVTCSLADGGSGVDTNFTGVAGFVLEGQGANPGLDFTGAVAQRLYLVNCNVSSATGDAANFDDTGATSDAFAVGCKFSVPSGSAGAALAMTSTATVLRATDCIFEHGDGAGAGATVASVATGAALEAFGGSMQGTAVFSSAATPGSVLRGVYIDSGLAAAVTTNALVTLDGIYVNSAATPVVDGVGIAIIGTPISATPAAGSGVSPGGGVLMSQLWQGSAAPGGTWAGSDPVTLQSALDRMAALLVTLNGGPIP